MCLPYSLWISDSLKLAADVEWNCTVSSPFSPPISSLQTLGNHLPGRDYQGAISMSHSAHAVVSNICSYSWPPCLAVTNPRNLKVVEAGGGGGRKQKLLWCFSCSLRIWRNVPFKWLVHLFSGVLWAEWQQLPAVTKWEVTLSVSLRVSSSPVWSLSLHCKNPLRQKQGYSMKCFCD